MELEGYEKTGNTKILEIGEHIITESIPIFPVSNNVYGKKCFRFSQMGTNIPKEYSLVDIKEVHFEPVGVYMVIISQNIVPVEVSEYKITGTDLVGYYSYGKEVVREEEKGKQKINKK